MFVEKERKFLILNDDYKNLSIRHIPIRQGYLSVDVERTVRIRQKGDHAYITVKGASDPTGTSRIEWEKSISIDELNVLMPLCLPGVISKIRHEVIWEENLIEVDEFLGDNLGLVIAEIEYEKNGAFPDILPDWIGQEVTGDARYYNSALSENPYKSWE